MRWLEAPLVPFSDIRVVTTVAAFDVIALFELIKPDWVVVDWRLPDYFKEELKLLVTSSGSVFAEVGTPDHDAEHPYLWQLDRRGWH